MTPFFALGDDLALGAGAAFTFRWTQNLSIEAEGSVGQDATRTSVSLLYALPQWGRVSIYVAGGGGIQHDEVPSDERMLEGMRLMGQSPGGIRDFMLPQGWEFITERKTEFAVNIGAGVTIPVSDRWAYRSDFRWYNPKAEWPESWRAFNGLTVALRR